MRQCDGGNRSNAAVLCGALDADLQQLPYAEFCYNNTVHSSTKMTPFYANFGYHPGHNYPAIEVISTVHQEQKSGAWAPLWCLQKTFNWQNVFLGAHAT